MSKDISHNCFEFIILILGLHIAKTSNIFVLHIKGDSKLVVNGIKNKINVQAKKLYKLKKYA